MITATDRFGGLRELASDPRLGAARIRVLDAETGRVLLSRADDRPGATGSVMKVITAATALGVLGPDHRIKTRVLRGRDAGEIVLQGGGDVTLSRVAGGGVSVYGKTARFEELARSARSALGDERVKLIVLDDSLFAGSEWHDTDWAEEDRDPGGYMPRISSLQVDGDRDDPTSFESPRSADPTARAGAAFAAFFEEGVQLIRGRAAADAEILATVSSPTVWALIREMLCTSDNAIAEALARLVTNAVGESMSFAGIGRALTLQLAAFGVPVEGVRLIDGSGLSASIRMSAVSVTDLIRRAHAREGVLGLIDDLLARSGASGTLASRFSGENAVVGDAVRAKTGYIDTVHALAGVVRTVEGSDLIFAVFAEGSAMSHDDPAKCAIDDFVTALHLRGEALRRTRITIERTTRE